MSDETYTLRPKNAGEAIKVAQAVLERRDRNVEAMAARAGKVKKLRADRKKLAKPMGLISASKMVLANKTRKADAKRIRITKRAGMNKRMAAIPDDAKLLLVIRNDRKVNDNKIEKALAQLRLTVGSNGRFVLPTEDNLECMRIAETYIYYGVPKDQTISDLLHKKAYVRRDGKAVPMNDNIFIEEQLGSHGVFCVEDIDDIIRKGITGDVAKFNAVSDLLTSFHLANYRKCHGALRTSKPIWGWVRKIDKVAKHIA